VVELRLAATFKLSLIKYIVVVVNVVYDRMWHVDLRIVSVPLSQMLLLIKVASLLLWIIVFSLNRCDALIFSIFMLLQNKCHWTSRQVISLLLWRSRELHS
jgi:hypothetical protein